MGKVRKLRRKYKALCAKNDDNAPSQNTETTSNVVMETDDFLSEGVSDTIEDNRSVARSTYSISKSIKSSLGGMSIQKKDKQKLRHALFLSRLNDSKETFDRLKNTKKKETKLHFKDELPVLKIFEDTNKNSSTKIAKKTKIEMKNQNAPRKGMLKHRNQQLARNVNQFREMLKNSSLYLYKNVTNK